MLRILGLLKTGSVMCTEFGCLRRGQNTAEVARKLLEHVPKWRVALHGCLMPSQQPSRKHVVLDRLFFFATFSKRRAPAPHFGASTAWNNVRVCAPLNGEDVMTNCPFIHSAPQSLLFSTGLVRVSQLLHLRLAFVATPGAMQSKVMRQSYKISIHLLVLAMPRGDPNCQPIQKLKAQ